MGDLFGDEEDVDGDGSPAPDDGLTSPERLKRKRLEYEEEDQEDGQEDIPLREADVQVPNVPIPKSADGDYWVMRLPNFVKLDSKPFHPDTYVEPEQEDDDTSTEASKERSLSIKLEVENTIRWRWVKDEDGNDRKQSNSRIIRWSDGTLSLQLGKELFDVNQNIDTSALMPRGALGGSQQSQQQSTASTSRIRGAGLTYLVAQHKRAEVLQAEKVITGHLTLRPTGMQSETHRKLVRAVGQKHNKVARLKMAPTELVQKDPGRELAELAKNAAKTRPKKPSRRDETFITPRKRRGGGGGGGRRDFYDEDEAVDAYDSEDDMDTSLRKGKKRADEERKGGEYQTDDFLVSDEEEEEDERAPRRRARDKDESRDVLDEAEERIERAEKKRQGGKDSDEEDSDAKMDVESEEEDEDDDDASIRRTTGRRRRVAVDEEDEEE
ncbi:hypothetical protein M422DRAFT_229707 [Sphaerobolus stellatus SS14]|uniref:RNA polymerase-associated protein LEO1 n=1 Tax=Sphaerobolus stellatus (strain SS14) TaxID=990650 RepID=A0A0C9UDW3_SPHS4|nr:hypothetical protein M422DRAFT_229707 [Sphaerobolus stellatus SS14]